jgi:quinol monooxygenase YgiN
MLIVAGEFVVDPERREEFLRSREAGMRASRAEAGCHDYVLSADPVDAGRVVLYERWEDKAALAAHLVALRTRPAAGPDAVPALSSSLAQYEISAVGAIGS